jgi:LysM repeat protein
MACTFGGSPPTRTPAPSATFVPVVIDARGTPDPTTTAVPAAATATTVTNTTANCVVRSDWLTYIVQAGDTLGSLAQRTNSTIAALATANCLANPDALYVGQAVRVPRTPSAVIPPPVLRDDACPPTGNDNPALPVVISPYLLYQHGCYLLSPGTTVTVSWTQAPPNFVEVTFWRIIPNLEHNDVIGVDTFAGDGAVISWVVPTTMNPSTIYAIASVGPNNSPQSNIVGVTIYP